MNEADRYSYYQGAQSVRKNAAITGQVVPDSSSFSVIQPDYTAAFGYLSALTMAAYASKDAQDRQQYLEKAADLIHKINATCVFTTENPSSI